MNSKENSPYKYDQKNACDYLKDTTCPVQANHRITYKLSMPIPQLPLQKLPMTLEFALLNDRGKIALCFRVPVVFVNMKCC